MKLNELKADLLFEMANLGKKHTGFDKIIYISTAQASHGPRVKIFHKTGKGEPSTSISIEDDPKVVADSLNPPQSEIDDVIRFVKLNKVDLLKFWHHGTDMMKDDVDALIDGLKKI